MTDEEILKIFNDFLKEHGAYDAYWVNARNTKRIHFPTDQTYVHETIVACGFSWTDSEEGINYWITIDNLWFSHSENYDFGTRSWRPVFELGLLQYHQPNRSKKDSSKEMDRKLGTIQEVLHVLADGHTIVDAVGHIWFLNEEPMIVCGQESTLEITDIALPCTIEKNIEYLYEWEWFEKAVPKTAISLEYEWHRLTTIAKQEPCAGAVKTGRKFKLVDDKPILVKE